MKRKKKKIHQSMRRLADRELTVFESSSCLVCARTLSTPAWSTKVTKPKPLRGGEGGNTHHRHLIFHLSHWEDFHCKSRNFRSIIPQNVFPFHSIPSLCCITFLLLNFKKEARSDFHQILTKCREIVYLFSMLTIYICIKNALSNLLF